ncbi:MAG: MmcQ/YjbR family DNA-binding protein [Caulobacteraceae bacterium]|nr:MmcQ/YjbR family DNA-binding protein [Caulobacteraceae bacterium]
MTEDEVRDLVMSFPEASEGVSYGKPAFKVAGKFFTRIRAEDQSLVLTGVSFDEREMYMEAEPATFHITAHYKDYPAVLARIASVDAGTVRVLLERRWREIAPRKLVRARDAESSIR